MSNISLIDKIAEFDSEHCYQYQRRIETLEEDKFYHNLSDDDIAHISLEDFDFSPIQNDKDKKRATLFIKRYEWLGTIGSYPTHWFQAVHKNGVLGGVIIMSMPNAFSSLLGEKTKEIERLIARGASASWTPFNLGSKFLMWCIKWMVNNTPYRLFTCYSDPTAKELGSIYQALNFYYLGQDSGASVRCINPYNSTKVITDRAFRARSFYKRYAKDLGIEWKNDWCNDQSMLWENIPDNIEAKLRAYSKEMYEKAKKVEVPPKHKYAFVLGRDKRETNALRKEFLQRNKVLPYPKQRGFDNKDFAKRVEIRQNSTKEIIELTLF